MASRVSNQNVKLESEHKECFYSLPLINNGGEAYFHSLRRQCCKEVFEDPEKYRPLLDVITAAPAMPKADLFSQAAVAYMPHLPAEKQMVLLGAPC